MKKPFLCIAVVLSALAVLVMGSWWAWREWYAAEQVRAAKEAGDAAKVCRLLRWGARADEVEDLLHWAAEKGDTDMAKLLLANGADPNTESGYGKTPLEIMPDLAKIMKEVEAEKAGKKQPAQPKGATP